ncbi:MAG: NAD(P)H-hydrate dehydratase [Candidatus Eisenbacteria bacterium]|nr:NAD(P)H-hydrate dehydratase [Candidatus Eisenbacteria bacterium]
MKLVSSETMRLIDTECIEGLGIPGLKLMESAGAGTVRFIVRELGSVDAGTVSVVCGKGNNGGDGFVIARELRRLGADVHVFLAGHTDDVSGDARTNLERLGSPGVSELSDGRSIAHFLETMAGSDLVVDAVFGTGFSGVPRGLSGTVIGQMNVCGRPILSVDVPSGLNATSGATEGECVRATWTCTMGLPKMGFYLHPGRAMVGHLHVIDIGIPKKAIDQVGVRENVLMPDEARRLLPKRPGAGHKGTFGRVLVLAGSVGYTGAAALTATAALRAGSGLVFLGVPSSLNDVMETKLTEVITRPLPEAGARGLSAAALPAVREMLGDADALAIGPGLSRDPDTQTLVRSVVAEVAVPCVIDADALNVLTVEEIGRREGGGPAVLTPHPGEMSRLTGRAVPDILANRVEVARDIAARAKASVVLKGAASVIADPGGEVWLNPTGNSGMASGGTGDVLTGVVASLLGQGMNPTEGAVLGTYIHGVAGDLAAESLGERGMIAGDVLDHLPLALVETEE